MCICVSVYAWISASTRSILTGQVSSSLFFFCVIAGQKSVFGLVFTIKNFFVAHYFKGYF